MTATPSGTVEDEETAPSTIVDWSATGDNIGISVEQMEMPDPPNKDAQLATFDRTDNDVIDTSQCSGTLPKDGGDRATRRFPHMS